MNAEHQQLEWKETWRDDHLKWVSAFANTQGGTLVIGRDDTGRAVGLPNAPKLLEDLPNKVRDLLGVVVQVNSRQEGGQDLLEVITPAYPTPISYRGHYYQRSGSTLQELKGAALDRFLLRRYGRTWDGAPPCPASRWPTCQLAPSRGSARWPRAAAGWMKRRWPSPMPRC